MATIKMNDVASIKGISDRRSAHLQNKLEIMTLEDLTTADANVIYEVLRAEGDSIGHSQVEAWIAEAKRLVTQSAGGEYALKKNTKTKNQTAGQLNTNSEWETIDQFFVDFQINRKETDANNTRTKIHHMNNGGDEASWPGFEGHLAGEWMLAQLDPSLYEVSFSEPKTTAISATPAKKTEKQSAPVNAELQAIEIAKVAFYQPSRESEPVQYSPSQKAMWEPILGSEPTSIQVQFALVCQIDQQVDYSAKFYLHNKLTGEQRHLGDSEKAGLVLAEETHTATLSNVSLERGVYSLQTIVKVNNKPPTIGFLEIPLIQVV